MIKGEKVYLRLIDISDINIIYNFCLDKDVIKYNEGISNLPEKTYILKNFYKIKRYYSRLLSILNEKNIIIGFMNYDPIEEEKYVYKVGMTIGKRFWGRGYGIDSMNSIIKYLFEERNAHKILVDVNRNNIRAIKCYNSCGFKKVNMSNLSNIIQMCLCKRYIKS